MFIIKRLTTIGPAVESTPHIHERVYKIHLICTPKSHTWSVTLCPSNKNANACFIFPCMLHARPFHRS
jgi:hypothetical protein